MKKQLLIAAMAFASSSAFAIINDRTVHNDSDHVVFVAWKNWTGSKSRYERILPGETKTFGVVDRGYGIIGAYGNTLQVDLGGKIGKGGGETYRNQVKTNNKDMDKYKEAFIQNAGSGIQVKTSGEVK